MFHADENDDDYGDVLMHYSTANWAKCYAYDEKRLDLRNSKIWF